MPELPEVETMVRGIRSAVEGRVIEDFEACPNRCRPLTMKPFLAVQQARARGKRIVEVRRRAKRILLVLEDGGAFVIEPRMTGLLLLGAALSVALDADTGRRFRTNMRALLVPGALTALALGWVMRLFPL